MLFVRRRRRLLDGELAGQDLAQHRPEDVPVLDVDPVLRGGNEPAAKRCPLTDLLEVEEVGRVRDVPGRLECLLRRRAREGGDPVGAELLVAADRDGQVRAAEEARHRLAGRVARHHELRGRGLVLVADAAGEPAGADDRARVAVRVHAVRGRAALVGRLARLRGGGEEVLVRRQAGDRLRRLEQCPSTCRSPARRSCRRSRRRSPSRRTSRCRRCRRASSPSCRTSCSASPASAVNSARLFGVRLDPGLPCTGRSGR